MSPSNRGNSPRLGGKKRKSESGREPGLTGERALLHLAELLDSQDEEVRTQAAFQLSELRDDRAADALMRIVREPGYFDLRRRAAHALGPIGSAVVPELLLMLPLEWDYEFDNCCALALGHIARHNPDTRQVIYPIVSQLFYSPLDYQRSAAVRAMSVMADSVFLPELIDTARSNQNARAGHWAAEGLGNLGSMARRTDVIDALFEHLQFEHADGAARSPSAEALGKIGDPTTIPRAIDRIQNGDYRCCNLLGQMVEYGIRDAATPYLLQALPEMTTASNKIAIIQSLGRTHDVHAVDALLDLLGTDIELEDEFVQALGMLRDKRAVPKLVSILHTSGDTNILSSTIGALDFIDDPSVAQALVPFVRDPQAGGWVAIAMLGRFRYAPAVPALIPLLALSAPFRHITIEALAKIGSPDALTALVVLVSQKEIADLKGNFSPEAFEAVEEWRRSHPAR